jgi:hypothetical protein
MMFLVRSAFWLSLVYAHMPLESGEIQRAVDQTKGAIVASAAESAKAKCAQEPSACRAIIGAAAGVLLTPRLVASADFRDTAPQTGGKSKMARPSANSLKAADMSPPWRGRSAKSGA